MGGGNFDTLTVTGNAQVDSLGVTNNAQASSLDVGMISEALTYKVSFHLDQPAGGQPIGKAIDIQGWCRGILPAPPPQKGVTPFSGPYPLALQPQGGNVGIGTTAPAMPLHVSGGGNQLLLLQSTKGGPGNTVALSFQTYGTIGDTPNPTASLSAMDDGKFSSHLVFMTKRPGQDKNGQSEWVRITSTGDVGIGTSSPSSKLDVHGDVRINDNKIWIRGDSYHGLGWGGGGFAGSNVDGPVLFGFGGGALGTTSGGQKIALSWDANGDVHFGHNVAGDVNVIGDIHLMAGAADCAEEFNVVALESVEPGTVMVIDEGGALKPSLRAYDKRVAGVISGAGDLRPGITLDRQDRVAHRLPLALTGKVYCKVDAQYGPVELGDLLTTSPTSGYAMKAVDRGMAFGAVIGKALGGLADGKGLIPILVALQ